MFVTIAIIIVVSDKIIAQNRKARHNFELYDRYEAGLILEGWELKSLRAGQVQIAESYVMVRAGDALILGSVINPLASIDLTKEGGAKVIPDRTRKLLLKQNEINKISVALRQKGYSCVCLSLYWKKHLVKCEIALAKGKRAYDKRHAIKERELSREP